MLNEIVEIIVALHDGAELNSSFPFEFFNAIILIVVQADRPWLDIKYIRFNNTTQFLREIYQDPRRKMVFKEHSVKKKIIWCSLFFFDDDFWKKSITLEIFVLIILLVKT